MIVAMDPERRQRVLTVAERAARKAGGRYVVRAKWTMDGAATPEEAAAHLRAFAENLEALGEAGWRFEDPVEDDYGCLIHPDIPLNDPGEA